MHACCCLVLESTLVGDTTALAIGTFSDVVIHRQKDFRAFCQTDYSYGNTLGVGAALDAADTNAIPLVRF